MLHRVPASPPIDHREKLPLPSADSNHAAHWAAHPGSPDEGLIQQCCLDLADICRPLHESLLSLTSSLLLMRRMLRVENKDPVVRSRRTKESVEVDDDLGRKRGGAGGMKDSQLGIIVHDQGILRERFGTVRAALLETLNHCQKALFVVEDEHMAFSYTNSWKLARSATSLALLKNWCRRMPYAHLQRRTTPSGRD